MFLGEVMILAHLSWFCMAFYCPYVADMTLWERVGPEITQATHQDVASKTLTIFCLRHAEKVDDSRDPALSQVGKQRAALLAKMLKDLEISQIHTTDYLRTRDTVAPLANAKGLKPATYDPRSLKSFAEELKRQQGVHVVVGHSNTTPDLVKWLGGDPGEPIIEASEYDRLYIVTIVDGVAASSMVLRFGESSR